MAVAGDDSAYNCLVLHQNTSIVMHQCEQIPRMHKFRMSAAFCQ